MIELGRAHYNGYSVTLFFFNLSRKKEVLPTSSSVLTNLAYIGVIIIHELFQVLYHAPQYYAVKLRALIICTNRSVFATCFVGSFQLYPVVRQSLKISEARLV